MGSTSCEVLSPSTASLDRGCRSRRGSRGRAVRAARGVGRAALCPGAAMRHHLSMRIALVYPPPWKIAAPDEPQSAYGDDGPPPDYKDGDLDADFYQTPYGLFSLGAQAIRAGHQVKVFNLSSYPWTKRRGGHRAARRRRSAACRAGPRTAAACASSPRSSSAATRSAHVVVGGPHATPLGPELLAHYAARRHGLRRRERRHVPRARRPPRARASRTRGIAGTVYRDGDDVVEAPERKPIADLDDLASPHDVLRHAHPDDVARLPVDVHVLRRRDHVGPRLPRQLGRVRARRDAEGRSRGCP